MKIQLIMLDTPIIVSGEEIREGDYILTDKNITGRVIKVSDNGIGIEIKIIRKDNNLEYYPLTCKKIIAGIEGLPSIDWNGLEEEFGYIDVEKLANQIYQPESSSISKYAKDLAIPKRKAFINGFKKAKSLNEKKFSLEEVKKAYREGFKQRAKPKPNNAEIFFNSLQQPKVFDIEIEMEYGWDSSGKKHSRPKITNNSIKILRSL